MLINTLAEIFTLSLVAINCHSFALPGLCDECCPSGDHPDQGNHSDSALCCTTPPLPCRWQFGHSPPLRPTLPECVMYPYLVPSPKASSHHKHNHGVGWILQFRPSPLEIFSSFLRAAGFRYYVAVPGSLIGVFCASLQASQRIAGLDRVSPPGVFEAE